MAKCDLCGDESTILYTVKKSGESGNEEYHLCKECLEIVHEAYVQL